MARCSSCIECWFNVISPSCALTSVAETVLTWFRKHHAYVKGLRAAREAEAAQRGALEASPVFGFSKIKFMLAVSKSYLSVYLVGAAPEKFYIWHALQFAVLLPVQAYRWHHMRGLAYFAEFCWVANVCLAAYLSVIVLAPHLVGASLRGVLYRLAFAFGAGPLQSSVVFLGNSLVPHSIDHLMSLVIHLTPALTAWSLRHAATVDASLFPREVVSFADYVAPPLCFLLVWASFHTFFMLALGPRLRARGLSTTYDYNMSGNASFNAVLGRIGDGRDETARFLKYEAISVTLNASVICATFPLFAYAPASLHFSLVVLTTLVSCYNGASWYAHRFGKVTTSIDQLLREAEARNEEKDSQAHSE